MPRLLEKIHARLCRVTRIVEDSEYIGVRCDCGSENDDQRNPAPAAHAGSFCMSRSTECAGGLSARNRECSLVSMLAAQGAGAPLRTTEHRDRVLEEAVSAHQ